MENIGRSPLYSMKKKPLTNQAGQVRELTRKAIRAMQSASELRYSPEVVSYFKKTGEGWQIRMRSNEAMRSSNE